MSSGYTETVHCEADVRAVTAAVGCAQHRGSVDPSAATKHLGMVATSRRPGAAVCGRAAVVLMQAVPGPLPHVAPYNSSRSKKGCQVTKPGQAELRPEFARRAAAFTAANARR